MISKSLDRLFLFGKLLALTPSFSSEKLTLLQKLYSFSIPLLITASVVISVINRNFYNDHVHMKRAVSALLDFNLLLFNYCTVGVVFWKRDSWRKLMRNLKTIVAKLEGEKSRLMLVFVTFQVLGVLIIFWCLKTWMDIYGIWYFERYNIQYFQFYLLFTYNMFLCLIIGLILRMYNKIYVALYQLNDCLILKKIDYFLCFLRDTVDVFNDIFQWPIALIIFHTSLYILNDSYNIFVKSSFYKSNDKYVAMKVTSDFSLVLLIFVSTSVLIIKCDLVLVEAERVLLRAQRLRKSFKNLTPDVKEELNDFCCTVIENFPVFTAARFFEIRRSVILNILGTVTTFLIIMIQFLFSRDVVTTT